MPQQVLGVDEVYTHSGTDQVTVDGSGSKTLNGGSGQDTLDINYSGVYGFVGIIYLL